MELAFLIKVCPKLSADPFCCGARNGWLPLDTMLKIKVSELMSFRFSSIVGKQASDNVGTSFDLSLVVLKAAKVLFLM